MRAYRMGRVALLCGLTGLAACGVGRGAGEGVADVVTPLALEGPPVFALMGFRSDLDLTSAQIAALDSIATDLRSRNGPLLDRLEASNAGDRRQPAAVRVTAESAPIVDEIRANARRAEEGVSSLLSEGQRAEVCELFDRTRRGGRDDVRAGADARRRGMREGAGGSLRPWYWCVPPATESDGGR